jgi:fermentation-respiration switch protein FrsA (DUF1100 family)
MSAIARLVMSPRLRLLTSWLLQSPQAGALPIARATVDPPRARRRVLGPGGWNEWTGHPERVDRPILAGWSYGVLVAAHWASRHPDRTLGAVLVDGAYPYDWLDEAMEQRIRKLYRRMGWFMPLLRPTGLTGQ